MNAMIVDVLLILCAVTAWAAVCVYKAADLAQQHLADLRNLPRRDIALAFRRRVAEIAIYAGCMTMGVITALLVVGTLLGSYIGSILAILPGSLLLSAVSRRVARRYSQRLS